jgi:hypothetical protein
MSLHSDTHSQTKNTIYNVYKYFKKLSMDSSNPEIATFFKQTFIVNHYSELGELKNSSLELFI